MLTYIKAPNLAKHFDLFVHETVRGNKTECKKHRNFLASQMTAGFLALIAIPVYTAFASSLSWFTAISLLIMSCAFIAAFYVSLSAKLSHGITMSAFLFTALVTWVALHTGGLTSPFLFWLFAVPIEISLTRSKFLLKASLVLVFVALTTISIMPSMITTIEIAGLSSFWAGFAVMTAFGYCAFLLYKMIKIQDKNFVSSESAVKSLPQSKNNYNLVLEYCSDIILEMDQQGKVLSELTQNLSHYDINLETLKGTNLFDGIHVADRPAYMSALFDVEESNNPKPIEIRLRSNEQPQFIWFKVSFYKNHQTVFAILQDISQIKAFEESLNASEEHVKTSESSKAHFLANMSHELRTPLNAILGFSDILKQGVFGAIANKKQEEYITLIHNSGEHLLNLVNDILDVSKIETGHFSVVPEPFDVTHTVQNVIDILRHSAEQKGIKIILNMSENLPELNADKRAVKQMMINLLSNAIKFSDDGNIAVNIKQDGPNIFFCVKDQGIGINEIHLKNIGQPFYQADTNYDRRHQGTGLGLSVVKGLVDLHEGSFKITSEEGKGTSVFIKLPIKGSLMLNKKKNISPVNLKDYKIMNVAAEENERRNAAKQQDAKIQKDLAYQNQACKLF